ncbi:N-6 DNA methylase [Streptacidiphilus carbonis]|uniref:N-6 DNA methylase n=1 Tax=Streptacidiphilus carbonis TaxID=105422 RepID=UPI0005A85C87|nr:N-6 DNA methylase [Streptacidiphilus carbonis]
MAQGDGAAVTAGGIARLAGVGRAAVSNWRRRHADFPRPIGGTDTSPTFDLAEVERWLRDEGKIGQVPARERVWQQIEQDPDGIAPALQLVGSFLVLMQHQEHAGAGPDGAGGSGKAARETRVSAAALASALRERLGKDHPVPVPDTAAVAAHADLLRGVGELAAELGVRQAFEFLMGRHLDSGPRQYTLTPPGPAELMAQLAGPADRVLDPACGFGGLLRAARPGAVLLGQEADPGPAGLAALRLALNSRGPVDIQVGDSLRADAFGGSDADAVLCHPPFNERNWGYDELAYDPRWEYGLPPRTESELAWVQHALSRVREGGTVVLLMPPAAASRRSGRRIRADLLRRGALRAVVALPAGAAPPYGIPLHLWVLRRPGAGAPAPQQLLLVDTGGLADAGEKASWQALHTAVADTWRAFDREGAVDGVPGVSRSLQVVELLDDDVDLTPARHLPLRAVGEGAADLAAVRERLTAALGRSAELAPVVGGSAQTAHWSLTSVGELAKAGALLLRTGTAISAGTAAASGGYAGTGHAGTRDAATGAARAVLTEHDIVAGGPPSGVLLDGDDREQVLVEAGDVVIPALGRAAVTRVVDRSGAGAALGRGVHLLRADPVSLDPWFLAGFLRGTANNRQASSYTSTATRLDVRRLQVPRLPLDDQRRYGERFRALAAFEDSLRSVGRLGEQLLQGLHDELTDGSAK